MIARSFKIMLAFLFAFPALFAKTYDLTSILKLAESNNRQIQLAKADLKTASAEKLNAFSRAIPKIDVNAGYNRNLQANVFFFEVTDPVTGELQQGSFKTSFSNEFRLNAVLRQTLFSMDVGYAIQAARYFDKFTHFNFQSVRQQVITQVKTAFYGTLLAKDVLRVANDSQASAKDNYENIKAKFDAGVVSEFELLQAEVRWQNSIPRTLRAKQEYQSALNNLKALTGIPIEHEIELQGSLAYYPELPPAIGVEDVKGQRPDFNALTWEKKLQQKNVSAQRAGFFPSLEGTFSYSYSAASDQFKLQRENDNYIVGVSLKIPIFSGGSTIAKVRKASAEVDRVNTRIAKTVDDIKLSLENTQLRLTEAMQRIKATETAVKSAQRAFEIAETRVENGLSTQVELKDSRVELDQAQVNYFSAIFDYLKAYFDWEQTTGAVTFGGF